MHVGLRGRDAADHERLAVAAQRVLKHARQLRVPVGDVNLPSLGVVAEGADDVPQRQQPLVDVHALEMSVKKRWHNTRGNALSLQKLI